MAKNLKDYLGGSASVIAARKKLQDAKVKLDNETRALAGVKKGDAFYADIIKRYNSAKSAVTEAQTATDSVIEKATNYFNKNKESITAKDTAADKATTTSNIDSAIAQRDRMAAQGLDTTAIDKTIAAAKKKAAAPSPIVSTTDAGNNGSGDKQQEPEDFAGLLKTAPAFISKMSGPERKLLAKSLNDSLGLKLPVSESIAPDALLGAYQGAISGAQARYNVFKDIFTVNQYLQTKKIETAAAAAGAGTSTANVPPITDYPVVSSATDAQKLINDVFQANLNRDATVAEVKLLYPLLKKAQLDNPTSYKETTLNGKKARVQYSGLDSAQWLLDQIKSNAALNLKSELDTAKTEAPDLAKRLSDKKIYDKMIADAGNDFTKIQAAKETTAYGRGLAELEATIQAKALESGASNDPAEITALAKSLYDKGINPNSSVGLSQIESALKYAADVTTGKFKGTAATTVADLQATAAANGLDLQKNFGDQIAGWISAINSGEQVDNIKQQIRDVAKLGQPDSVKKLIDNGIDLSTIYSPYKNAMASTLEINPQTIGMDDPTLRSAITPTGEMNLYDYSKMLRKDNRWQYTQQANGEVADATKKILQDFGFMG